ncbi:methyl-accepting chemotaxis protein [Fluviispira vulneris]|uniref:methyl-accepting chemotaxis protein n=1 Tax=Fluviispira vulneris TaxID=2763012 RepID=UPI001644DDA9|nr:methyl-accepting chemotaxis protein [Fluviispira vulneris]
MDKKILLDNQNKSGFKDKITFLLAITNFIVAFITLLFVYFLGDRSIFYYHVVAIISLILFFQLILSQKLKKNQQRSFIVGSLFQTYIQKSHEISDEFEYPRKNIEKSFDHQFDLINQTAAAIAEITQMIGRTNEQINDCKAITETTERRVEAGSEIMKKLSSSIEVIKNASEDMDKMVQIISQIGLKSAVIADIVAKTELLAMNASIEAARAGEYGKGFSVVSEEVESLARTSGKSAKQIKDLLNESSMKVTQIIRTMNERIKEGEVVSLQAFSAYEHIKEGVAVLKEQVQIINEGTALQQGVIKNASEILAQVTEAIHANNKILAKSDISIKQLVDVNLMLFELSEEIQRVVSGPMAALRMKENRASEVKRILQQLGY